MSTYEPGTVAIATVRGVPNVRVFRGEGFWRTAVELGGNVTHHDFNDGVTDVRPLVVLDLGPGSTPATDAARLLRSGDSNAGYETFLDWLADQIEAQTKPPRIPEPGLWGVVEASTTGDPHTRRRYGRTARNTWTREDSATQWEWAEFIDPTLVRDGIEDES